MTGILSVVFCPAPSNAGNEATLKLKLKEVGLPVYLCYIMYSELCFSFLCTFYGLCEGGLFICRRRWFIRSIFCSLVAGINKTSYRWFFWAILGRLRHWDKELLVRFGRWTVSWLLKWKMQKNVKFYCRPKQPKLHNYRCHCMQSLVALAFAWLFVIFLSTCYRGNRIALDFLNAFAFNVSWD